MAMENRHTLTSALVKEIEAWLKDNNIGVKNKERIERIVSSDVLTHKDVPILYGEIGSDLAERIKTILQTE